MQNLILVYVDDEYTDFLREVDNRVPYNINRTYQRPFVGALIRIKEILYFAPLTTSSKGKKLMQNPKEESITFLPIDNCKFGGINFNNMIPIIDGVYTPVDLIPQKTDTKRQTAEKIKFSRIVRFLRKNQEKIIIKAKKIYNMQKSGLLYKNYMAVTCNFDLLENQCKKWLEDT